MSVCGWWAGNNRRQISYILFPFEEGVKLIRGDCTVPILEFTITGLVQPKDCVSA